MSIVIERGIPLPPDISKIGDLTKTLSSMEIGDSILITSNQRSAQSAASKYGHQNGKRFTSRTMNTGLRIWRKE